MATTRRLSDHDTDEQTETGILKSDINEETSDIGGGKIFQISRKRNSAVKDGPQKVKKKSFAKRFRKEWMNEPLFKGWLYPVPSNPERCFCAVCNVDLMAGHSELEKHASGKKHCDTLLANLNSLQEIDNIAAEPNEFVLVEPKDEGIDSNDTVETVMETSELVTDRDFVYVDNGAILTTPNLAKLPIKVIDGRGVFSSIKATVNKNSPAIIKGVKQATRGKAVATAQLVQQDIKANALPENPDAQKLLHCLNSDSDDDEESLYNDFEDSTQLLRDMRAELAYAERKRSDQQMRTSEMRLDSPSEEKGSLEDLQRHLAQRESDAKLNLIEERRKHNLNIYKLKLIHMETKIRHAEVELRRSGEIHKIRLENLKRQKMEDG